MVYENESGKLVLHNTAIYQLKIELSSSGSNENHKKIPMQSSSDGFIWDLLQM